MSFKFKIGQTVKITATGKTGTVIGRAEYANDYDSYSVSYLEKNDLPVSRVFYQGQLEASKPPRIFRITSSPSDKKCNGRKELKAYLRPGDEVHVYFRGELEANENQ